MARRRKSKADIHAQALREFEAAWTATREDRDRSVEMRRFVNIPGAQWEWDEWGAFDNRMKFEVNKVALACTRIKNEFRNNQISADFMPKDGTNADALADLCASRYRADTFDGIGIQARESAYDEVIDGGFGAWRLRAEYENEEKEWQRICVEPVHDAALSVFFDANATRMDKSDARHAFYVIPITVDAYRDEWGDEGATWPGGERTPGITFDWYRADVLYIAEYFIREKYKATKRVFKFHDGTEVEHYESDIDDDEVETLLATGYTEEESYQENCDRVIKYVMNGSRILSGPEVLPGKNIPLIPAYGHRAIISGIERWRGHAQMGRDAQIIKNIQLSKVGEVAALSPVEKPIFSREQIGPHGEMWKNDHIDNNAYLLLEQLRDGAGNPIPVGEIGFTKSPQVAPAVGALIQIAEQDLQDILGNPQNGEKLEPDASGRAMELVQSRIDAQTYGYIANMAIAERRCAEIYLSMAKDVYVEEGRVLKVVTKSGDRDTAELGRKVMNPKTGAVDAELDFSRADYDIEVDVGPSSSSKREATVRAVKEMMGLTQDPETQIVLGYVALMNMQGEGIIEVREWSRKKLVGMQVIEPTKEEQDEMDAAMEQAQQPDPQAVLAEGMAAEANAKAIKAQADAGKAVADTELAKAKTAETLANIPIAQRKAAIDGTKAIMDGINGGTGGRQDPGQ